MGFLLKHLKSRTVWLIHKTMNILELMRRKQVREERVEDAKRVSLCYRGNVYVRSLKN